MARATTALIHRTPFRVPSDSLFRELWNAPIQRTRTAPAAQAFVPRVDAVETPDEYRVTAELPGLDEKDFEIVLEDGVLTLKGEKHAPALEEGETRRRVESHYGSFERKLRFDTAIDQDNVKAKFVNGVLTIQLPKPAEARPQVRTVPVQSA